MIYLEQAPSSDVTEVKPEVIEEPPPIKTEKNDDGAASLDSMGGIESLASCSSWTPADIHQHVHMPSKRPHPGENQEEFLMADFQDNSKYISHNF